MHEGGVSVQHRSVVGPTSLTDENGKTDTDHTVSLIFLTCYYYLACLVLLLKE